MSDVVGPGFISITVSDVQRSADFYERHLELPGRSRGRGTPGREGPAADGRRPPPLRAAIGRSSLRTNARVRA
jgi:hypothetical protein